MASAAWVCLLAPLAGAVAITLLGTRVSRAAAGWLATGSVVVSAVAAAVAFLAALGRDETERSAVSTAWTWLSTDRFQVGLAILVDPLSLLMMLVVAGVGSLIVGYSVGYMHGADEERRYFAYMALFVFSMLTLVLAANFLVLLAGWGLVGLCSYLLIGFEHERASAIAAAKKAFVMNAIGDAAMALAFFLLIYRTGALDYAATFARAGGLSDTVVTLVALGLLTGAVAKSAQVPLHTWLPDAMEGPTPVSALIHAATMVTAGVYVIARTHPIFEAAPLVSDLAAGLGAVTLLVAGLIALVQTDVKRVIAYSTMSQIGYMFLGAGIGAYGNAMFHLMTHAFFKALLFLAAGVVIHALLGEQDLRRMGGLARLLPRTRTAMLVGALALAAVPPLSGFFSKDAVLASALARADAWGIGLYAAGLAGAFLTAVYTFRMIFLVFGGEPSAFVREHLGVSAGSRAHGEAPASMAVPVAVLTVLAVVGGFVQIPGVWHPFATFLDAAAFGGREHLARVEPSGLQDAFTSVLSVALSLAGIALAWLVYARRRLAVPPLTAVRRALEHKLYVDEAYDAVFYRPASFLGAAGRRWFEEPVIAGSLRGLTDGVRALGRGLSEAQTGYLRTYALAIAGGVAVLALVFVSVR